MEQNQTEALPNFEASLEQLQGIVKKLESGELTLDQSLKSFEDGVRLTRACQEFLSAADQRIQILTQSTTDQKADLQPFNPNRG